MTDTKKTLTRLRMFNLMIFKEVMFRYILDGMTKIDSERFYKKCKAEAFKTTKTEFELEYFYELLKTSHCFLVDDGTHGTVTFPKVIRDWDKAFLEETGELFNREEENENHI